MWQLFFCLILAFGQDAAPEDIKPSDCDNTHFLIQEGGTIQIRIRPKSLPFGQHFPEQCNLTFVVPKPWTDILFSFSHCDNEGMDPPCGGEWTKYSYITNSGVLFSINNNSDVNEVGLAYCWVQDYRFFSKAWGRKEIDDASPLHITGSQASRLMITLLIVWSNWLSI